MEKDIRGGRKEEERREHTEKYRKTMYMLRSSSR